jgi:hypothetical protein
MDAAGHRAWRESVARALAARREQGARQREVDTSIEHDWMRGICGAIQETLLILECLPTNPYASKVATADALRAGGSVDEVCGILRRLLALADEARTKQD